MSSGLFDIYISVLTNIWSALDWFRIIRMLKIWSLSIDIDQVMCLSRAHYHE